MEWLAQMTVSFTDAEAEAVTVALAQAFARVDDVDAPEARALSAAIRKVYESRDELAHERRKALRV